MNVVYENHGSTIAHYIHTVFLFLWLIFIFFSTHYEKQNTSSSLCVYEMGGSNACVPMDPDSLEVAADGMLC